MSSSVLGASTLAKLILATDDTTTTTAVVNVRGWSTAALTVIGGSAGTVVQTSSSLTELALIGSSSGGVQ